MTDTFGQWLKAQREDRGMSLRDVERATDGKVSNAALSQIETGHTKNPGITQIVLISGALGLPGNLVLDEFTRRDGEVARTPEFCPHCGQVMR